MRDFAIASFAKRGRENYPSALPRLIDSAIKAGFKGDFVMCAPELPAVEIYDNVLNSPILDLPSHDTVPYGFKPRIMEISHDSGYKKVLWCDSTIFFVKNPEELWEKADRGVLLFENPGCPENVWTSDDCLAKIGCSIEEATTITQTMACAMGFDFKNKKAVEVFNEWLEISKDGVSFQGRSLSSRPEFRGHRHDQSVISYLAHKHGIAKIPYGVLSYWNDRQQFNSHICNRGIGQP